MRRELVSGVAVGLSEAAHVEAQREDVCAWATRWLAWRAACAARPAAVFDIDATLLNGDALIPSVVALYNTAGELGMVRFIITARSTDGKAYTRDELAKHNIAPPRHLYMHPQDKPCSTSAEAGAAKEWARKKIAEKGYTLLLNIGDAFHDHYTPPSHAELHHAIPSDACAAFVDPNDGCAHVKLAHVRPHRG